MKIHPVKALPLAIAALLWVFGSARASERTGAAEVRGTWLTTTANSAIATPAATARTMSTLRQIGFNTVYVETWKNGYTQFPSEVLQKTIGVKLRPAPPEQRGQTCAAGDAGRDLVQEALTQAHRNGLLYISWFEYGFMAAHKDTINLLRTQKPEWLSRDAHGSEVAPNGFVWLNPVHPEAQQFLLDITLEAIDKYDLDGVQLDDHVVWPSLNMGYDDYTKTAYAYEHAGQQPPSDIHDPEWIRWRAEKVNTFAKRFVQEVRRRRPGLLISLSPAIHPWAWEHYLLDWPKWSAWSAADRLPGAMDAPGKGDSSAPRWDEFVPQAYRMSYDDFERTWLAQVEAMRASGGNRQRDLLAGIRIVGDGKDSSWDQLRRSIELTRQLGNGGHVLWFSRGVLDLYPDQLKAFYQGKTVPSPQFPRGWRAPAVALKPMLSATAADFLQWKLPALLPPQYSIIAYDGQCWDNLGTPTAERGVVKLAKRYTQAELLVDRRGQLRMVPK